MLNIGVWEEIGVHTPLLSHKIIAMRFWCRRRVARHVSQIRFVAQRSGIIMPQYVSHRFTEDSSNGSQKRFTEDSSNARKRNM